ncbi:MAG: DUF3800 domain-containing protein, partial [Verrucomicrobiales bacterium]|nr:DUF3800 domain-containing protein [Verrucomicrobiales bacterium]
MHFYVDESGHTGTNLFDPAQPRLYYGVLHSREDIDTAAEPRVKALRSQFGVDRLHASELGLTKLEAIVPELLKLHEECDPFFDLYRVEKTDHAAICFFDQVFDADLNPAVPWTGYWTPLRYILLMKVAELFDLETLKDAWGARIDKSDKTATPRFLKVCSTIRQRVASLSDARSRELVSDALDWAMKNPDKIGYNATSKDLVLNIAPNMIGFQFVMAGIARRLDDPSQASRIVVDQQSQFNKSQKSLAEVYSNMRHAPAYLGPGMPQMDLANFPHVPIEFCAGQDSVGLELVDLYLWIFKRFFDERPLP